MDVDFSSFIGKSRIGVAQNLLASAVRIAFSILGGIFAIGVVESILSMLMLLKFGLAGSQPRGAVYVAVMIAGMMFIAGSLGAFTMLATAMARDIWALRERWYLPMVLLALAIYSALLLLAFIADLSKFYGEMLAEKRLGIGIYLTLASVAALIGFWRHNRLPR